jgi:hypothetical protein
MTRAIILTTQRTGSTFLEDCLESHPQVFCVGELLINGINVRAPQALMRWRYAAKLYRFVVGGAWHPTALMERFFSSQDKPVKVFKAMYNHVSPPWTLNYLRNDRELRVIHLQRRNLLKMYVSKLLLSKKRVKAWQPHATSPVPPVSTYVSPQAALASMRKARALHDRYDRAFAQHAKMAIAYEEMIENGALSPRVSAAVCDFLGIAHHPMASRLIKINPDNLRAMIANYDEVAAVVSRTEFAELLE